MNSQKTNGNLAFTISGNSMEPVLHDGFTVVTDRRTPVDNDIIVCSLDNELFCRRLRATGDQLSLISENKEYPEIKIKNQKFDIIGVVVKSYYDFY